MTTLPSSFLHLPTRTLDRTNDSTVVQYHVCFKSACFLLPSSESLHYSSASHLAGMLIQIQLMEIRDFWCDNSISQSVILSAESHRLADLNAGRSLRRLLAARQGEQTSCPSAVHPVMGIFLNWLAACSGNTLSILVN